MNRTLLAFLLCSLGAQAQMVPITSRGIDNASSGWNSHETQLTQASIRAKGLRRLPAIPLQGDARGSEGQPLILPSVQVSDGTTHDVLWQCSMANWARGVDAHTGVNVWPDIYLGRAIDSSPKIDFHSINQHWGCLSTGVIDPDTARVYQVAWISQDGSGTPESGRYMMFVVDLHTGTLVVPAILVQGDDPSMWKQRSSLVMTNVGGVKTIFFAHGSVYETGGGWKGYTGGTTAFDVATNTVSAQLPMTSGIWQAGAKLSADADGTLYAITGNGDFDPSKGWFGESFVKVKYTPTQTVVEKITCFPDDLKKHPDWKVVACNAGSDSREIQVTGIEAIQPATLAVVDQWSPWSDFQRTGQQQVPNAKLAGESAPSEEVKPVGGNMAMSIKDAKLVATMNEQGQPQVLVYPNMAKGPWADEDWGSAGPACFFAIKVCVATGKDGIGYAIRTDQLGGTTAANVGTAANYAKLAAPCAWLTMSPGPIPCAPADPKTLNFFPGGLTAHLHAQPVTFWNPVLNTWEMAVGGENQRVHLWAVSATGQLKYIAEGNEYASSEVRGNPPGGMTGSNCTGSSNGFDPNSYLLFCAQPYGDANANVTRARLLVYNPLNIINGRMETLWDSQSWGNGPGGNWYVLFNKFMPGLIDGGTWFYPNYGGSLERFSQQ